jgi:hypothetical protein
MADLLLRVQEKLHSNQAASRYMNGSYVVSNLQNKWVLVSFINESDLKIKRSILTSIEISLLLSVLPTTAF